MAAAILWTLLLVSVLRALEALANRSWRTMWFAAACSLVFCIVAGFGLGPFVIVLTFLQLASAVALRVKAGPLGWLGLLLSGIVVWVVGFPGQVWAWSWALWLVAFLLGSLILAMPAPTLRRRVPS